MSRVDWDSNPNIRTAIPDELCLLHQYGLLYFISFQCFQVVQAACIGSPFKPLHLLRFICQLFIYFTLNHLTFIPTYLPLSLYRSSKFLPVIQSFGRLLLFIYSFIYTVSFLKHYKTMFYRFLLIIILFYYTTLNVRNITIQ